MMQLYPDPDDLARAQDSIQNRLTNFDKKLWVPDREDVIAAKDGKKAKADKADEAIATGDPATDAALEQAAEEKETKSARRSTRRSSKKSSPKVKQQKAKSQPSVSRSVRRRK